MALVTGWGSPPAPGESLRVEWGQDPQEAVKEEQGWSQGTAGAPSSIPQPRPWICPAPLGNTSETVGIIQERSQGLPAGGAQGGHITFPHPICKDALQCQGSPETELDPQKQTQRQSSNAEHPFERIHPSILKPDLPQPPPVTSPATSAVRKPSRVQ